MNFLIAGLDKDHSGKVSAEELAEIVNTPRVMDAVVSFGRLADADGRLPSIELRSGELSWTACVNRPGNAEAELISENRRFEWKLDEYRPADPDASPWPRN